MCVLWLFVAKSVLVMVPAFLLIYFASGFSALLYQVIWQRMLAIFSGADVFAATTIVASFMAGLGFGSFAGGVLADRIGVRRQIALFALAECLTGVLGLLSKWWCYDVLYVRFGAIAGSPALLAALLFASLLIPTFLMGMTLPLLSKALTPEAHLAGRRIGSLYALNTLGAACGAFATGWYFMGRLSFPEILRVGAGINFLVAALAVFIGVIYSSKGRADGMAATAADGADPTPPVFSFRVWVLIYAVSGFVALSLEILWFRLLGVMLKSNSLTFPHLLGIYLMSLAAGLMVGARFVRVGKRPATVFIALQAGITVYAGLSIATLVLGLERWQFLHWLREYFGSYDPLDTRVVREAVERLLSGADSLTSLIRGPHPNFLSLYILVPIVLVAPPTLLMGLSFPFLQRSVQQHPDWIGRRVGWLQAANIFGSTVGAICVGGILLGTLGSMGTLRLLVAVGGIFLILYAMLAARADLKKSRTAQIFALAVVALVIWSIPSRGALWGALHGAPSGEVIHAEDGSGLSVLKHERRASGPMTLVYTNGLGQSWIPYTDDQIHSLLGIVPAMLHESPLDVAVIGLGSGDTLYSLAGREETREIVCMEIVSAELETLRMLHRRRPYAALERLFADPRIRFVFRDGRTHLNTNSKKYDIIEADALRPTSAFAGNLYSVEYFELLKSRLKPGGFAVTWGPTRRVVQSFLKVFPYVFRFGPILLGSAEPIKLDRAAIKSRMERSSTQAHYSIVGIDVKKLAMGFFEAPVQALEVDRASLDLADVNSDLLPKDEYAR